MMNFLSPITKSQFLLILVASAALICSTFIPNSNNEFEPSKDVKKLDEKLLKDLQNQRIEIDPKASAILDCATVTEQELKTLFALKNVDYAQCEPGNCHYTSYFIKGKTENGQQISFVLTSGEDGNHIKNVMAESPECNALLMQNSVNPNK